MTRWIVGAVVVVAACAWSNSLYQARSLSNDADRAERQHHPGEAQATWGQVVVKAESAYARSPGGHRGSEALWLIAHGEARSGDCLSAAPALRRVLVVDPNARWRPTLLLDLARCDESNGDGAAVAVYATLLRESNDTAIRREAHRKEGHLLVVHGEWQDGLASLAGDDTLPARLDRATADARLGRADSALAELRPALVAGDTAVPWDDYVGLLAAVNTRVTDTLLTRLLALPRFPDERRSAWLLRAASAAATRDTAAADRWLAQLATRPVGRSVIDGRALALQFRLERARSLPALREAVAAAKRAGPLAMGSLASVRVQDLEAREQAIVTRTDSTRAGTPNGDLATFLVAEFARDSLDSPAISSWLYARIERDWPDSPYLGKALLARIAVEPDSATALIARFRGHPADPYVAAAAGDVGARVRVAELEDSLSRFAAHFRIMPRNVSHVAQ